MIGFETIGNATVTVFDDKPMLSTDPWIFGNPYFGSWGHSYKITKPQLDNIKNSKYFFKKIRHLYTHAYLRLLTLKVCPTERFPS